MNINWKYYLQRALQLFCPPSLSATLLSVFVQPQHVLTLEAPGYTSCALSKEDQDLLPVRNKKQKAEKKTK